MGIEAIRMEVSMMASRVTEIYPSKIDFSWEITVFSNFCCSIPWVLPFSLIFISNTQKQFNKTFSLYLSYSQCSSHPYIAELTFHYRNKSGLSSHFNIVFSLYVAFPLVESLYSIPILSFRFFPPVFFLETIRGFLPNSQCSSMNPVCKT